MYDDVTLCKVDYLHILLCEDRIYIIFEIPVEGDGGCSTRMLGAGAPQAGKLSKART